ncbi:MAG: hypothetical protein JJE51_12195 [Thermoanaerobaculia bacterium]|nr:hypothetical protein [Thermoanaerobaculia bacterium]
MKKAGTKETRDGVGSLDGGEGRGVPIDELEDDESIDDSPTLDDFEALIETDDATPADRRRDPLRH